MKMSSPRFTTWFVATAAGLAGLLMHFGVLRLGSLNRYSFWFLVAGFILLSLANLTKSL